MVKRYIEKIDKDLYLYISPLNFIKLQLAGGGEERGSTYFKL